MKNFCKHKKVYFNDMKKKLFSLRFPIEDDRIMFTFHSMEIALEAKVINHKH